MGVKLDFPTPDDDTVCVSLSFAALHMLSLLIQLLIFETTTSQLQAGVETSCLVFFL